MDPRGPGGANGPRWVGGWHFHRQHQHGEQDSEEVAASNAPLGAPLQHLNGSMLIYVRISCDERARRARPHRICAAASACLTLEAARCGR